MYISEKELKHAQTIDSNIYQPDDSNLERWHPYGVLARPDIIAKIKEDNLKHKSDVEDFYATEITKKVTASYEKSYEEIQKVLSQKMANSDMGSFYTFLFDNKQ